MTNHRSIALSALILASLGGVQIGAAHAQQPPVIAAEFKLPDTPVGEKMGLYLKALAAKDRGALIAFLKANYPSVTAEAQADQMMMIQEQSGGMTPLSVDPRSTPTAIAVKCQSRNSGREFVQVMKVEAAPPHNITAIGLANGGYDISAFLAPKP